ncbi:MAG: ATP-dependent DNA helicase RecG [Pirellulales bacterium]
MSKPQETAAQTLATPVQFIKGVGPHRAEILARLGLMTVRDILFFFPRDYQDLTNLQSLGNLEEGKLVTVRGKVEEVELRGTGTGRSLLGVLIREGNHFLRALWFNQPFMQERFSHGQEVVLSGTPRHNGGVWEMPHPRLGELEDDSGQPKCGLLPVYPLTEGLNQGQIRRVVQGVLESYAGVLDEVFPAEYLAAHRLQPIQRALPAIHFPPDRATLDAARRRFVYQELFILQLALALKRQTGHDLRRAPPLPATAKIDARIKRLFPFELTPGQQQAISEIAADMAADRPMNRLLQGDVGSGKTVVAAYALLLAVAGGYQAALMAPTEVLARQHMQTLDRFLSASQVRRRLLTGGLSAKERAETLAAIAAGEVDLVVGTQAIVQADVEFAKLGLVVIDEQHKFGVRQRATLKQAGFDPHYMVMTATPIPRTVAMTLFGDLDVSILRDSPPGRQTVRTYLADDGQRQRWWDFVGRKLREGRQGYVITPLVDESDQIESTSLEETYEALANGELEAFRLGLIHGRLTAAEKEDRMEAFRRGEIQVLVATSVVEVGVDVPNATLMTIENAERFGLSQLHQLRGRISRGAYPGFCCAFAESASEESRRRLDAFVNSTDGFRLAEVDFALRGPGNLFGTRQHGLPPLRIADLARDGELLDEARRDARDLVSADPGLVRPEHARLRRMVLVRYGKALDLGDVG